MEYINYMELTKNKALTAKDARDVAMSVNGKDANDGQEIGYYVVHSTGSTAEGQVVHQTTKIVPTNDETYDV